MYYFNALQLYCISSTKVNSYNVVICILLITDMQDSIMQIRKADFQSPISLTHEMKSRNWEFGVLKDALHALFLMSCKIKYYYMR